MPEKINDIIKASIETKQAILNDAAFVKKMEDVVDVLVQAFARGNKVWFCGNGGSAADAQHLAAEFSGRFYKNRKALPSEALHTNTSYLTAVANDFSYEVIYSRLVEGLLVKDDVLVGLSTSGNSPNIVKAFEQAQSQGVITIGFTGAHGGKLKMLSDYLFNVPSNDTPRIQESHIMIGHIICELTEEILFPDA